MTYPPVQVAERHHSHLLKMRYFVENAEEYRFCFGVRCVTIWRFLWRIKHT